MCNSCEMVMINGVACHESGCPESWKDEWKGCKECGTSFQPESKNQDCCSEDCSKMYHGW